MIEQKGTAGGGKNGFHYLAAVGGNLQSFSMKVQFQTRTI
jgi:hypothetical protein